MTIAVALLAEIPTGALADRLGRRPSLALAFALHGGGYLLLAAVRDLPSLILALVVITLGRALYSGTFEALLYESLTERGEESRYPALIARTNGVHLASCAAAMVAGGFLYAVEPRLPFLASAGAQAIGVPLALALREPRREVQRLRGRELLNGFRLLLASRAARLAVLPLLVVASLAAVSEEILDDVLAVELGYTPQQLGLFFAVVYLAAAISSAFVPALVRRFESRTLALVFGLAIALSLLATPWLGKGVGGLAILLRSGLRSILDGVASAAINPLAGTAHRATTLSTFQLLRTLPYVLSAYGIGVLMDLYTAIGFAGAYGAGMLLVLGLYWALGHRR